MQLNIRSKLPDVGTTIFTVMSQLAAESRAIDLSQGFPDFDVSEQLAERVSHHIRQGRNQYAPMAGVRPLREAIAAKVHRLYGWLPDCDDEITVTAGATEALYCAIHAFVHAGDEVILLDPSYDAYEPDVRLAGGKAVRIPLAGEDFHVDWDRVRDAVSERTRMMILNTPHNPSGSVFSAADIDALAAIVRDTSIILVSDEVYEHIVFDGLRHESLLRDERLRPRSLVVSSFGKTYHATGWKVGYCVSVAPLMNEMRSVHQWVDFAVVTPIQHALADHMRSTPLYEAELSRFYENKRDTFLALMQDSRFRLSAARGTYFQLADFSDISDMPDIEFARWLTTQAGVAAIPVSVFCKEPLHRSLVRFCFAKHDATLEAAAEKLCAI